MFQKIDESEILKIYQLYCTSSEQVEKNVAAIMEWLRQQEHLPEIMDKDVVRNFLIQNKFSVEKAKGKIDTYYTFRSYTSDWFHNTNPNSQRLLDSFVNNKWAILPRPVNSLYRALFFKTYEAGDFRPHEVLSTFLNIFEIRMKEDFVFGDILVTDYGNINFQDIVKITPASVFNTFNMYQKVYSYPVKAIYIINAPPAISKLMTLLQNVLKPKIFERFHVCPDASILKEVFDEDELPSDYGGKERSVKELNEEMTQKFLQYKYRYDSLDHLRVDETRRLKTGSELGIFGKIGAMKMFHTKA